jgi:hypothetical protein
MSVEPITIAEQDSEDLAQRKKWTEIEIEFLRKTSNRDFERWLKDRQGKSQPATQF